MTERERLIDLIKQKQDGGTKYGDHILHETKCSNAELADFLLENGIIVPPVKIGDEIYIICCKKVFGYKIHHITSFNNALDMYFQFYQERDKCNHYASFRERNIGQYIFLTREEAENALKEQKK